MSLTEGSEVWYGKDGMMRGPGFVVPEGYTRPLALQSVGPGWADLVNMLFDFITHEEKYNNTHVVISQVKEKFGTLRVYVSVSANTPNTDNKEDCHKDSVAKMWYVQGFIAALERMSAHVCEDCGNPGQLRGGGWLHTACDEHSRGRRLVDLTDQTGK